MKRLRRTAGFGMLVPLIAALACSEPGPSTGADESTADQSNSAGQSNSSGSDVPTFEYDPTWPKPLPNSWILGSVGAMAIDSRDHVWVAQRPASTTDPGERMAMTGDSECCAPAPPVIEFDPAGNVVQAWGPIHDDKGQPLGKQTWGPFPDVEWPLQEHGIYVDHKNNVWVDSWVAPSPLLKFTGDGKFLMRIGKGEGKSSNDTANLAGPTGMVVDPATNELFVADGYRNQRVIVFDADTGAYKRHWGAYGKRPPDGPQTRSPSGPPSEGKYDPNVRSQQFAVVHCIMRSNDGLLYVCDRVNDRIQVFRTDGTFVKEGLVAPQTKSFGSVFAIGFSPDPDQRFLYVADGANKKVWILQRDDLKVVGSFGSGGRGGGQLLVTHALAVDSQGNVYVGESAGGNRVQKFKIVGARPSTTN